MNKPIELNKAKLLYLHDGHESHAVLLIGEICLHAHCYEERFLIPQNYREKEDNVIWVYLDIGECIMEKYVPEETNPFFGSLRPHWPNPHMIGSLKVNYSVFVRHPDSMTRSTWSSVDYFGPVEIEGTGKIIGRDEEGHPVVASCGLFFSAEIAPEVLFVPQEGDEVLFKGFLHVFAA